MNCEALKALQADLLEELASDLLAPLGSYSIDGQAVSRENWTLKKYDILERLDFLIQRCEPYEIKTNVAP